MENAGWLNSQTRLNFGTSTTGPQFGEKMEQKKVQVLLVEDSATDALLLLRKGFSDDPKFVLTRAKRLDEALEMLQRNSFDIIVSDLGLPDSFGLGTFQRLLVNAPEIPIII